MSFAEALESTPRTLYGSLGAAACCGRDEWKDRWKAGGAGGGGRQKEARRRRQWFARAEETGRTTPGRTLWNNKRSRSGGEAGLAEDEVDAKPRAKDDGGEAEEEELDATDEAGTAGAAEPGVEAAAEEEAVETRSLGESGKRGGMVVGLSLGSSNSWRGPVGNEFEKGGRGRIEVVVDERTGRFRLLEPPSSFCRSVLVVRR